MGLIPLSQDDVRKELYDMLVRGCADAAAKTLCSRGFLGGGKYISYFALTAAADKEPTLRIAFVTSDDTVRKKTLVLGERDVQKLFCDPAPLDGTVRESRAKRVVMCYSEPDGCDDVNYTLEKLQRLFYAVSSAEIYDMVLIDGGELHSLIRVYKNTQNFN